MLHAVYYWFGPSQRSLKYGLRALLVLKTIIYTTGNLSLPWNNNKSWKRNLSQLAEKEQLTYTREVSLIDSEEPFYPEERRKGEKGKNSDGGKTKEEWKEWQASSGRKKDILQSDHNIYISILWGYQSNNHRHVFFSPSFLFPTPLYLWIVDPEGRDGLITIFLNYSEETFWLKNYFFALNIACHEKKTNINNLRTMLRMFGLQLLCQLSIIWCPWQGSDAGQESHAGQECQAL